MQRFMRLSGIVRAILLLAFVDCGALSSHADSFTFDFAGAVGDGPVNGTATLIVTSGSREVGLVLTNNLLNIVSVGQAISGFSFDVVTATGAAVNLGSIAITSQSGREVRFDDSPLGLDLGGTNSSDALGWGLSQLDTTYFSALGFTRPAGTNPPDELILGLPSSSTPTTVTYGNANASITRSDPHQPLVVGSAIFSFLIGPAWIGSWHPTSATMFFGTGPTSLHSTSEQCIPASLCGSQGAAVPEPSTVLLMGTGLGILAWLRIGRRMAR